jgi:Cytochrome c
MKRIALALIALVLIAGAAFVITVNRLDESPAASGPGNAQRGAYLAKVGHCAGCHTARGGAPYAGGRALATPFGTVYAANLTPDDSTGIGRWSDTDFWRALHNGRSADGRLLLPACPYPNFTQVSREDVRDLFAYLRNVPAARHTANAGCTSGPARRQPIAARTSPAAWRIAAPATANAMRGAPQMARSTFAAARLPRPAGTHRRSTMRARPALHSGRRPTWWRCSRAAATRTPA